MFSNIGIPGLILILVIAVIIFGPSKLPEIGRAFGRTIKEFKSATNDFVSSEIKEETNSEEKKAQLLAIEKKQEKAV